MVAEVQNAEVGRVSDRGQAVPRFVAVATIGEFILRRRKSAEGTGTGKNTIALTFFKIKIYPC